MQKISAREIIDEAVKAAETKKREALLEVKEESIKTKNELDKEIKERRAEIQRYETTCVKQGRATWTRKLEAIENVEKQSLTAREEELQATESRSSQAE